MNPTVIISEIIIIFIGFMFGASIASFLGVVIERVPRKEPITGRSHCACGRKLEWYENVPVFGWLRVMGKTKCCGTKLPIWYLFFELGLGIVGAFGAWLFLTTLV